MTNEEADRMAVYAIAIMERDKEIAALRAVRVAAQNLVNVKGRFHSEQAYQALVAALAALGSQPEGSQVAPGADEKKWGFPLAATLPPKACPFCGSTERHTCSVALGAALPPKEGGAS